jgi:hypothetical protein
MNGEYLMGCLCGTPKVNRNKFGVSELQRSEGSKKSKAKSLRNSGKVELHSARFLSMVSKPNPEKVPALYLHLSQVMRCIHHTVVHEFTQTTAQTR